MALLAITHPPSPRLTAGLRTYVDGPLPDVALARAQHDGYCAMLERCGATVERVDVNAEFPDGTFVEDTVVMLDDLAVLTRPGADERRREVDGIAAVLARHVETARLAAPARIDGGDVLRVGRTLYVGLSQRTDAEGIDALRAVAAPRGFTVRPVRFRDALHLKSAVTALPDGRLMINPAWVAPSELSARAPLLVPDTEPWGANTVTVHDTVCLPAEHPRTADLIRDAGYAVDTTPLSEFAAVEGGASCLSILIVVKGKATSRPSPVRTLPSHQDGSV